MKQNFIKNIIFFFCNIISYNYIKSFIIFPLEYLSNEKYLSFDNYINNNLLTPEEIMLKNFHKYLITKFEIGSPSKNISLLIEPNEDTFYIASSIFSKLSEEKAIELNFFKFSKNDLYNELLSSSFDEGVCHIRTHDIYHYSEICDSKEKMKFNINNKIVEKIFPIKIVRENDDNIPGVIGLLLNDSLYGTHREFINELKDKKLIDNYYWCFHFDEIVPLENKLKGQFIFGGKPNEVFPDKFNSKEYKSTHPYIAPSALKSWKLRFDNIYLNEQKNSYFQKNIISFTYEIYNIIGTNEFQYKIKSLFLNQLIKDKKCFTGNFTQNIFTPNKMIFYYCDISTKDILYENLNSINFVSIDLDNTFEITKDDLYFIKDDYIYLNVIFSTKDFGFWMMGQMFLSKYNFVFNSDQKEIGFYKDSINNKNDGKKKNKFLNTLLIIIICFIFLFLGLIIGRKIYGMRRKILVNELIEEQNYDYRINKNNNIESSYKPIGENNSIFEMKKKFSE